MVKIYYDPFSDIFRIICLTPYLSSYPSIPIYHDRAKDLHAVVDSLEVYHGRANSKKPADCSFHLGDV